MAIIKLAAKTQSFRSVQGRFHHVHADGTAYLTGGAARELLKDALGLESRIPSDYDWTVIGKAYGYDRKPKKNKRIEVEWCAPHHSMKEFMRTRDFSINQVAVDSKGNIFVTKMALRSLKTNVLYAVNSELTPREAVRAIRFAGEYNMKLAPALADMIKSFSIADLESEPIYKRYSEQGFPMRQWMDKYHS